MEDFTKIKFDPNKLREARIRRGLTQESTGLAVGVKRAAICKIEKGNGGPSSDTLVRLCVLLEVSVNDLVSRAA